MSDAANDAVTTMKRIALFIFALFLLYLSAAIMGTVLVYLWRVLF